MSNSILDIKGFHTCLGRFSDGADLDLFDNSSKKGTNRASIVFGRNGAGKTTLSKDIALACDDPGSAGYFYDESGSQVALSGKSRVRVFNEDYVREKILVQGDSIEAIVMLGDQASAAERLGKIDAELQESNDKKTRLEEEVERLDSQLESLISEAKSLAKDGGWATRRQSVSGTKSNLTDARWEVICESKISRPRSDLQKDFDDLLGQYKRADALDSLIDWHMRKINPEDYSESKLMALLSYELDRPVITNREKRLLELACNGNQNMLDLAREAFSAQESTHCPLCQQEVTSEYKASLVESISNILNELAEGFEKRLDAAVLERLESSHDLPSQVSQDAAAMLQSALADANKVIDQCNNLLSQRKENLYVAFVPESLGLDDVISKVNEAVDFISEDIERLNESVKNSGKLKDQLLSLNDQIAHIDMREKLAKHYEVSKKSKEVREELQQENERQRRLQEEKVEQESKLKMTDIAVNLINRFLATVYFDAERFKLVASGDVYKIASYGNAVSPQSVSTGERNILALCYFFSEGGAGKISGSEDEDPQYLVIDDPVSSFDMENRVGICSLLRERIVCTLCGNPDSRVTLLTHDAATAAEFEHILSDINEGHGSILAQGKLCYSLFELVDGSTVGYSLKSNQYTVLLRKVYEYAMSTQDDELESCLIGNIMRRVLEGYCTFNYSMGIAAFSRDSELRNRFGDLESAFSNMMYRLTLNDDSHMKERVVSLNPALSFERYSCDEKRALARCMLVMLNCLDPVHIKKQIGESVNGKTVSLKELENNLCKWRRELSTN